MLCPYGEGHRAAVCKIGIEDADEDQQVDRRISDGPPQEQLFVLNFKGISEEDSCHRSRQHKHDDSHRQRLDDGETT